jgi:hypothetical protein
MADIIALNDEINRLGVELGVENGSKGEDQDLNAFAHAWASAVIAYEEGPHAAAVLGTAKEGWGLLQQLGKVITGEPLETLGDVLRDTTRDQYNNDVGILIAGYALKNGLPREAIAYLVLDALRSGRLVANEFTDPRVGVWNREIPLTYDGPSEVIQPLLRNLKERAPPTVPAHTSEEPAATRGHGAVPGVGAAPAEQVGDEQAPIPHLLSDDLTVRRSVTPPSYGEPLATLGMGRDQLMAAYLKIAEHEYIKAGGNIALAKRRAIGVLKSRYGASRLSGPPVIMEQPPEANYPAIDGGWDYLRALALQQARATEPAAQQISLVSDGTTLADRKAGRPPRYALWYRSADRNWTLAPLPFSIERGRIRALQRLGIERRRARASMAVERVREVLERSGPLEEARAATKGLVAPKVGAVEDGYRYLGGNPAGSNNWERV